MRDLLQHQTKITDTNTQRKPDKIVNKRTRKKEKTSDYREVDRRLLIKLHEGGSKKANHGG